MRLDTFSLALVFLAGCGSSSATNDGQPRSMDAADAGSGQDVGPSDGGATDAGSPTVELGTGTDHYESLTAGEKLIFNLGPQGGGRFGGYNIWGGVKASGVNPAGVTLDYVLTATSGAVLAHSNRMATLVPDGSGSYVAFGITVILDDCCKATMRPLHLHLQFMDQSGVTKTDDRDVVGADQCPRGPQNPGNPCQ
jgi:hypothetical protein